MAQASDILAAAVKEIGTVEQSGNRQKYGKAYGMDGVYWCMQFVWWCFQQADKALFMDGGKTASCGELMRWAQAHGQWVTTDYRAQLQKRAGLRTRRWTTLWRTSTAAT